MSKDDFSAHLRKKRACGGGGGKPRMLVPGGPLRGIRTGAGMDGIWLTILSPLELVGG